MRKKKGEKKEGMNEIEREREGREKVSKRERQREREREREREGGKKEVREKRTNE